MQFLTADYADVADRKVIVRSGRCRVSLLILCPKSAANPCRVASKVEHCIDLDDLFLDEVVDSKRESLRQRTIKSEFYRMNAANRIKESKSAARAAAK